MVTKVKPNKVRLLAELLLDKDLLSPKVIWSLDIISTNSKSPVPRTRSHCTASGLEDVQCNEVLGEVVDNEEVECGRWKVGWNPGPQMGHFDDASAIRLFHQRE